MSVEQSRGAELPVGGTPAASADGVKMQILSTEHWSLLATRSLGYTDSFGRANMFFAVLSGAFRPNAKGLTSLETDTLRRGSPTWSVAG